MPTHFVFHGTELVESYTGHLKAKDLILQFPDAAYTTMRTVNQHFIFEWETHIDRLAKAASLRANKHISNEAVQDCIKPAVETAILVFENFITLQKQQELENQLGLPINPISAPPSSSVGMRSYSSAEEQEWFVRMQNSDEMRLYAVITTKEDRAAAAGISSSLPSLKPLAAGAISEALLPSRVIRSRSKLLHHQVPFEDPELEGWVYIEGLPPPTTEDCVKVEARVTPPRPDPTIKSVSWVRARKSLEEKMQKGVNECVMADSTGKIHEGLSSNFFVLKEGKLYTAPPGTVLAGTVMKMVGVVCEELGIPVVYEEPRISEANEWQAACVTSTTRLVLPINEFIIYHEDDTLDKVVSLPNPFNCDILRRLLDTVYRELILRSSQIISSDSSDEE